MSKFACTCGNVISDVLCPNDVTGNVLSDKCAEAYYDTISTVIKDYLEHLSQNTIDQWRAKHFNDAYPPNEPGHEMIHDVLASRLRDLTLAMLECDKCGRLWIQTAPGVNQYRGYSPDDPATRVKVLGFNTTDNKPREGT
jgi:hypothetical protein